MNDQKPKVIVIVGPTASGKTSLSIGLAKWFNGEIVSADSRQVYRGMDLGTGKVTKEEMDGIPHHLLDVAEPKEVYTVADYVLSGRAAITDIIERGKPPQLSSGSQRRAERNSRMGVGSKLPIVVGGTFFYIDALLGRVSTPKVPPNIFLRTELEKMSETTLFDMLQKKDPIRALVIDSKNKRRLVRALEIVDAIGTVPTSTADELYDVLTIGIRIEKEELRENISHRLNERIQLGMIDEVKQLHEHGVLWERLDEFGLEYRYVAQYLKEEISLDEMVSDLATKIGQFAKRQMTWLKRDKTIKWFQKKDTDTIFQTVKTFVEDR